MNIFKSSTGEISYLSQGNSKNDAILFIHGNSCNAEMFDSQFNKLSKKYYVIAPNLSGHGRSSESINDNAYSLQGLAKSIKELIDHITLKKVVLYGASLGGHIAIELIPMLNEKLNGIMISGAPPFKIPLNLPECFHESPAMAYIFKSDLTDDELQGLVDAWIYSKEDVKDNLKNWVRNTSPQFRSKLGNSIANSDGLSNEWDIIEEANVPIAILSGEHENLLNHDYLTQINPKYLFKDKVQIVADSLHFPNLENPIAFNKSLEEFVEYCFNKK